MGLESCLGCFARKEYAGYDDSKASKKETMGSKDETFGLASLLQKTVLTIYFRMAASASKRTEEVIYNKWLIDMPKLLDLCTIYGQSNSGIVGKIVENVFRNVSGFD